MSGAGPSVNAAERESSVFTEHPDGKPTIVRVQARGSALTKLTEPLTEDNWMAWRERMKRTLRLCGVEGYARGSIEKPIEPISAENWEFNDNYAQVVIINNITSTEMVHTSQCITAKAMWDNLEAVHESKGHQTIVSIIRNLFHTKAEEDSNISDHLNQLMTTVRKVVNDKRKAKQMKLKKKSTMKK
jgi:hypothetical protein